MPFLPPDSDAGGRRTTPGAWFLAIAGGLLAGLLLLNRLVPEPLSFREDGPEILYAVALTLFVSFLAARYAAEWAGKWRRSQAVRYGLIWIGIFLAAAVVHAYRGELSQVADRVLAELIPGRAVQSEPGTLRVRTASNGHFFINARVNGVSVRFLADTGASHIVLSRSAARRAGFDPEDLTYSRIYRTANGIGRGAPVTIDRLRVGDLEMTDIRASVNQAPLDHSLLGMTFFNRLSGYGVQNGVLTLRWRAR